MAQTYRIVLAAGGLLTKFIIGFLGFAIVAGWNTPPADRVVAASSPGDDEAVETAMTVTLRAPMGSIAKHLTLVDESGRELASVTQWTYGATTVVSRRSDGASVSYQLNVDGTARVYVHGSAWATRIDAREDGMIETSRKLDAPRTGPSTMINRFDPSAAQQTLARPASMSICQRVRTEETSKRDGDASLWVVANFIKNID